MKITISTFGTRGDVEPPLALSAGLTARGHQVTLLAPKAYARWIESYGVRWAELRFDFAEFMYNAEMKALLDAGRGREYMRALGAGIRKGSRQQLEDFWDAAQGADFIVQSNFGHGGVEIADQLKIPMAFLYFYPYAPTRAFPSYFLHLRRSLGGRYNLWTQLLAFRVIWHNYGPPLNQWRAQRWRLPPWKSYMQMLNSRESMGAPNLLAYSPSVLPKPDDWSENHHVIGPLPLKPSSDWNPPEALLEFLGRGPPPVYVGFGSMREGNPEENARAVVRALELTGQRGILLVGGGGALSRIPASADVLFLDNAPHRWLFPRMVAAVHHGGPGTLAAVLDAGLPSVIFPHVIDQHGWAAQVAKLGVGVNVAPLRRLSAEPLAAALREVVDDRALRDRAAKLGERVRAENGLESAVGLIERHAAAYGELRQLRHG